MAIIYGNPGKEYGDRRVYRILKELPDRFKIYAQPTLQDHASLSYPDYVVVDKKKGIIVLEVKDWKYIQEIRPGEALIYRGRKEDSAWETSPLEQARKHSYVLRNLLAEEPRLIQHYGPYQGNLMFPVEFACFLPHQPSSVVKSIQSVWGRDRIFGKDELESPVDLMNGLLEFPYCFNVKEELAAAALKVIHSYLYPHLIFDKQPERDGRFFQLNQHHLSLPMIPM